jgi:iron complex transport system permease protein
MELAQKTISITSAKHIYSALQARKKSLQPKILGLYVSLVIMCVVALNAGAVNVNVWQWLFADTSHLGHQALAQTVLWEIRTPRLLMTMITGAGLALCGTVLQAICRNPLADPGLIGVSSGAALLAGVAIACTGALHLPARVALYLVPISAFVGASLSLILVLKIANATSGMNTLLLILAGVAVNAGAMSLLGVIQYIVDDATLRQITFWSMGSYAGVGYMVFFITLLPITLGTLYFWKIKQQLMLMSCSEQQAKYQGVNTHKIKLHSLWAVAAIVAVCVSFTGIVGFVGLVVPHVCRMFIGAHLKILIPCSVVCGGLLVGTADIVARTIIIPAELPIGIITSIVGVPFFLYLIVKEKRRFSYV